MGQQSGTGTSTTHTFVVSPQRRIHILDGDKTGGGHGPRSNVPGKSRFPAHLTDDDIIAGIEAIANNPANYPGGTIPNQGKHPVDGDIQGVRTQVIVEPAGRGIVTAYPI